MHVRSSRLTARRGRMRSCDFSADSGRSLACLRLVPSHYHLRHRCLKDLVKDPSLFLGAVSPTPHATPTRHVEHDYFLCSAAVTWRSIRCYVVVCYRLPARAVDVAFLTLERALATLVTPLPAVNVPAHMLPSMHICALV